MGKRRGKGEGSIYQREDGLWIGAVDLGWSSGKRSRKVVNGRTRAEVAKRMQEVQPTVAQGLRLAPDRLTVEAYLADWVSNRIPGTVTSRTEALYLRAVEVYINPSIGKVRLTKLTPSDVSQMLADLEVKGYSPATRRMARATLRRALRFAEQDGLLSRNVAAIAEGPKLDHREGRSLTPEQAQTFLEAVVDNRLEAAYVLTLALGLRRGEILGLSWEDVVNAENAVVLTIRRQLVRDKFGVHLSDLKTVGSRRTLHLSAPLVEVLERHRVRQEAEELVRGKRWNNEWGLVFTSTIGTPLDPEQFGKTVPKICESAGLGHWSIHELRHSCASLLIAMEVPLEVVSEQMGHASIRVTKDVYGHLMPKARAKAAEAMRSVLFDEIISVRPHMSVGLATQMATPDVAGTHFEPVNRTFVGRPGLDPGTLGLKGTVRLLLCVEPVEDSLCFKGNGVVSCRSGLAAMQKYEAENEASGDLVIGNPLGHLQVRIAAVRVRVCVGPPTRVCGKVPAVRDQFNTDRARASPTGLTGWSRIDSADLIA